MADATLPNFVFTDEEKFDMQQVVDQQNNRVWAFSSSIQERIVARRQNLQCVMVWVAVTKTGRFPLLFVPAGVKFNFQRYIADILEGCLLPWAKMHFQRISWFLQQDSAPSYASKIIQSWKITQEVWHARSPGLNPLDFSIGSILETKACSFPHPTVESPKAKLVKKWATIRQEIIRAACFLFSARLRAVVKNMMHCIEQIFCRLKAFILAYQILYSSSNFTS